MKVITLEDHELKFLIDACDAVNVPGKVAHALAVLQDKLNAASNTREVDIPEKAKEN